MSQPSDLNHDLSGLMQELVAQFSDPHAFFRELIQNAIDAGSGEVEVSFEYDADAGVMTARVDDFGEGMSREIIENKLTKLFSSAKDADFTKIGKFGIGFVSVFAVEPDAVCVDTGRNGWFWRVLFDRDREYDLISLADPVEGTQIRVIKRMSQREFEAFRDRASEVIRYWCRHVRAPVFVDGVEINAPFDLEAPIKVTREEEGTRLVAGFIPQRQAPYGFYNRGLTLKEGDESPWPHVTLKIDSRYLEHTLTRDQVLQDEHYAKAMSLLEDAATEAIPRELFGHLERHAAAGELEEWARWGELACMYAATYGDFGGWRGEAPIFPVVGGEPVSAADLDALDRDRDVSLYVVGRDPALALALREDGVVTLAGGLDSAIARLSWMARQELAETRMTALERRARRVASMDRLVEPLKSLDEDYLWASPSGDPAARALCEGLRDLCRARGARLERVLPGHMGHVRDGRGRVAWLCEDAEAPLLRKKERDVSVRGVWEAEEVVVNVDEPGVARLITLYASMPEWAVHALLERLALGSDAEDIDVTRIHELLYGFQRVR